MRPVLTIALDLLALNLRLVLGRVVRGKGTDDALGERDAAVCLDSKFGFSDKTI
jgi:hypothetical protein